MNAREVIELDQFDQVILDGVRGRFTLYQRIKDKWGNQRGWSLIDEDLTRHELTRFSAAEREAMEFIPEGEQRPIKNAADVIDVADFEVVGHSRRPVDRFLRKELKRP